MQVTTKISRAVASKLISNFIKGNPHFKPWKGEHGQCSWFLVDGNPYTGVDPSKTITIAANIDDALVKTDNKMVEKSLITITGWHPDLPKQERDLKIWNYIGDQCKCLPYATKLFVPKGPVSQQGSGHFLVLPSCMSQHLFVDYGSLKPQISDYEKLVEAEQDRENKKNEVFNPTLTIWIGPCMNKTACVEIARKIAVEFGNCAVDSVDVQQKINVKSGWTGSTLKDACFEVITLRYKTFREARSALRKILVRKTDSSLKFWCVAGDNWEEKHKTVTTLFGNFNAESKNPSSVIWNNL